MAILNIIKTGSEARKVHNLTSLPFRSYSCVLMYYAYHMCTKISAAKNAHTKLFTTAENVNRVYSYFLLCIIYYLFIFT